ncbi:antitermination protein NusG [Flavobacterium cyanobacteriorum]|uniref:Antitermination protein NusG n=2 Tax=Flavobacterium cyanobacteriorum TaxID=2022802 RepID=A0A255YSJ7_9FLAO|nr:antitermination protein NusG [Flavobacterium cyanobacteriorum]
MPWYVLYTNPRAEKKVAAQLTALGMDVYCPLVTKVQQWSDRKKKIKTPLFTSYVFINIDEQHRDKVFSIKGVARYLYWLGKPAVVRDEEIAEIKKWLATDYLDVKMDNYSKGDEVEIKEGPFKNFKGIVQEIGNTTIRLALPSIGIILTLKYSKLPS